MITVYITNVSLPSIAQLEGLVSERRIERSASFRFEHDRRRGLGAEALLNHVLKERYPQIHTPVVLTVDEFQKPFLDQNSGVANVCFNLSHSGDYAICAIGEQPLGCDIELRRENNEGIARRFFTKNECANIADIDSFFKYWTLKESYMKAVGKGLSMPMNSFEVMMGEPISYECDTVETSYNGKLFDSVDGYFVAVCGEKSEEIKPELVWVEL